MKVPRVTSILLVVLSTLTLLNFILKYYAYFVLIVTSSKSTDEAVAGDDTESLHPHDLFVPLLTFIPTRSPVLTRPWVIVTSSFIEETVTGWVINFVLFFYLGKYLENIWGSREFVKFLSIIVLTSNLVLYFYYVSKTYLYDPSMLPVPPVIVSSMAINMGLFVAIKQRISNHYLLFFKGNLRIKVTYLPFIVLATFALLQVFYDSYSISFQLSACGFAISWIYLRYFKIGSNDRQSYLLPLAINRRRSNKNKHKYKSSITTPSNVSVAPHQKWAVATAAAAAASVAAPSASSASTKNSSPSLINPPLLDTSANFQFETSTLKGDRSEQFSLYTFCPYPFSILVKFLGDIVFDKLVQYQVLNKKDYFDDDEGNDDDGAFGNTSQQLMLNDAQSLQSTFFGLSPLKGAQGDVSTIPNASSKLKMAWDWIMSATPSGGDYDRLGIKNSMDKRRKLALKELE